jgi:hypothetical protein
MLLFSTLSLVRHGAAGARKTRSTYSPRHGLTIVCDIYRLHCLLCRSDDEIHVSVICLSRDEREYYKVKTVYSRAIDQLLYGHLAA